MFLHRLFPFYLFLTECCSLPFLVLLFSFFHSTDLPRESHPLTVIDVVHCAHNSNFSSYYSYPHSYAAAKLALFPSLECLGIRFYQRAFLVALWDSVLMLPNKLQHTQQLSTIPIYELTLFILNKAPPCPVTILTNYLLFRILMTSKFLLYLYFHLYIYEFQIARVRGESLSNLNAVLSLDYRMAVKFNRALGPNMQFPNLTFTRENSILNCKPMFLTAACADLPMCSPPTSNVICQNKSNCI